MEHRTLAALEAGLEEIRRFGADAQRFINSTVGRELNLRGVNARVIAGGTARVGDVLAKRPAD